jgi:hypothetical protein
VEKRILLFVVAATIGVAAAVTLYPSSSNRGPDPEQPQTWPPVEEGWCWDPDTEAWLAYKGGDGFPILFYEFVSWNWGLSPAEIDSIQTQNQSAWEAYWEHYQKVSDELLMWSSVNNAEPASQFYKEHWYIFYRYCTGPVGKYAPASGLLRILRSLRALIP